MSNASAKDSPKCQRSEDEELEIKGRRYRKSDALFGNHTIVLGQDKKLKMFTNFLVEDRFKKPEKEQRFKGLCDSCVVNCSNSSVPAE